MILIKKIKLATCQEYVLLHRDRQEHMKQYTRNWFWISLFRRAAPVIQEQAFRINSFYSKRLEWTLFSDSWQMGCITLPSFLLTSIHDNSWLSCANQISHTKMLWEERIPIILVSLFLLNFSLHTYDQMHGIKCCVCWVLTIANIHVKKNRALCLHQRIPSKPF